jgi:hypothetical protein
MATPFAVRLRIWAGSQESLNLNSKHRAPIPLLKFGKNSRAVVRTRSSSTYGKTGLIPQLQILCCRRPKAPREC